MQKTPFTCSCTENFPLIQISSILSVNFTSLWHKCQRVFWWTSCTSARHAGSFDCLMTSLVLIAMENGRGHCAYWQSYKVPNQTHRGIKRNWKMHAIKQIKVCAEYRDMLLRPRLDLSGTLHGLRPSGSWQTSLGLGNTSRYSAQILICIFQSRRWIQTGVTVLKRSIRVKIGIFCPVWPWNLTDDLEKQQGASILCWFKRCASFYSHQWIQTGVTVWKRPIWVKIDDFFLSRVTLKFVKWPSKITGHLFCATSSFLHHFVAIGEFKLELQSGNARFGPKSTMFWAVWPGNLTDDLRKNNKAPPLSLQHQALCVISWQSTHDHTGMQTAWSHRPETAIIRFWPLRRWPLASDLDLLYEHHLSLVMTMTEYFMIIRWWEHSEKGVTDGQTDGRTQPFIELLGRSWKIQRGT